MVQFTHLSLSIEHHSPLCEKNTTPERERKEMTTTQPNHTNKEQGRKQKKKVNNGAFNQAAKE